MIHCIGDSHAAVFSGEEVMQPIWSAGQRSNDQTPYFRSYRIGAATAYQLSNKISTIINIIETSPINKETDKILFCFGEVDIRAHLLEQSSIQNKNIESIVKECVNRYFDVINYFKDLGYSVMVWGPIASWNQPKIYGGPSFGTNLERNNATKIFNEYLESLCKNEDIEFLTIFYDMLLDNGETNPDSLDDWDGAHIHLSQRMFPKVIEKFKNKNLI